MLTAGRGQRPAEDPGGAAGARGLRAGHHRPAEGAADHPQPHPALRVPPARRPSPRRACSPTSTSRPASASPPRPSTWSCAGATARPATPSRCSTRWRPPARSRTRRSAVAESSTPSPTATPGRVSSPWPRRMAAGRDPRRLATDMLDHLRNGFLPLRPGAWSCCPTTPPPVSRIRPAGSGSPALVRAMEVIGEALADMRDSRRPPGHAGGGPGPRWRRPAADTVRAGAARAHRAAGGGVAAGACRRAAPLRRRRGGRAAAAARPERPAGGGARPPRSAAPG